MVKELDPYAALWHVLSEFVLRSEDWLYGNMQELDPENVDELVRGRVGVDACASSRVQGLWVADEVPDEVADGKVVVGRGRQAACSSCQAQYAGARHAAPPALRPAHDEAVRSIAHCPHPRSSH